MIKCQCNPEINTFYTIEIRTNFITTIRMLNLVSEKMKQPKRPLNFFFFLFTHFPNNQTEQYTFFIEMTNDHFLPKTSIFLNFFLENQT